MCFDDRQSVNQGLNVFNAQHGRDQFQPGPIDAALAVAEQVPGPYCQAVKGAARWG